MRIHDYIEELKEEIKTLNRMVSDKNKLLIEKEKEINRLCELVEYKVGQLECYLKELNEERKKVKQLEFDNKIYHEYKISYHLLKEYIEKLDNIRSENYEKIRKGE